MKKTITLLQIALLLTFMACNVEKDQTEGHDITAKINGETWYFYDVTTTRSADGDAMLKGQGYLNGDRGAQPVNLEITFVGVQDLASVKEGYTADFAPTTTGTSAWAVVNFPDLNRTFDTKLDSATTGTFTIEKIEDNNLVGNFNFKAKDQNGNLLNIESANFENIPVSQ